MGEGGEGAGKAPLSGLGKKGSSHILRERGLGGRWEKGEEEERQRQSRKGETETGDRGSEVLL